jgi:hypothetical protein
MFSALRAALALMLLATACSTDGGDPSSGGSGGAGAGAGAAAGKGGSGAGSGGASGGSGGASAGTGAASAGTGSGAFPATYGLLGAEWSVIDGVTGQPYANCEDVAADFFRIRLRNYEEGTGWDLDASCFEGKGTFGAPAGTWDIFGQLITRDDVALAGLSADGPELTEVRSGETIVFEPFVFEVFLHRLPWTVSKAGMPSTCEDVGASQVKINWLGESSLSVIKPCSAGTTDLIPFQGRRTLLDAELSDSSGRILATWELRFWELAGTGDQPPPTIAFDLP